MNQALGMIETRGLVALIEATDAMLKAANVTFAALGAGGFGAGHGVRGRRRGCRQSRHRRGRGGRRAPGRSGERAGNSKSARRPERFHGEVREGGEEVSSDYGRVVSGEPVSAGAMAQRWRR